MKKSKLQIFVFLFVLMLISPLIMAEVLETPHYLVTITRQCKEYEVVCNKVTYVGISKKTGQMIKLKGNTEHTLCSDGISPCMFIGYVFKNGKTSYHVSEAGDLTVLNGSKVTFQESGKWK